MAVDKNPDPASAKGLITAQKMSAKGRRFFLTSGAFTQRVL
jgi:hypothetical protein